MSDETQRRTRGVGREVCAASQRRRVPKMLRAISRPITVAADRAAERKADDSSTFSAVDF